MNGMKGHLKSFQNVHARRCQHPILTRFTFTSTDISIFRNFSTQKQSTKNWNTDKNMQKRGLETAEVYFNPFNVQMISERLYKQVFIDKNRTKEYDGTVLERCKSHLASHGLWDQKVEPAEPVNFDLPALEGVDLDDHFRNIALQQTFRYKELMDKLVERGIPASPDSWALQAGWTKYMMNGETQQVPFPDEDAYVFDVEVCMSNGQVPTLACAVSTEAWYSWCSDSLVSNTSRKQDAKITPDDLIPFESKSGEVFQPNRLWKEKIIIGHNVSYDRARIKEQYWLEKTRMRFMDTMSMHVAVSGITSYQRALKMTMRSREKSGESIYGKGSLGGMEWSKLSSLNNLADVYKLYCSGAELKKDARNFFVKGSIEDIHNNFQDLMSYCATDVKATYEVFTQLLPSFCERFPNPVTMCGTLEMGTTYLPINENWKKYISHCEAAYKSAEKELKSILIQKAVEALDLLKDEKFKTDPWLWDLDWKVTKPRVSKKSKAEGADSGAGKESIKEYPAWYKKLLKKKTDKDYEPGPVNLSPSMQIAPKLLRLTWFGFPLNYSRSGGWGFLVKRKLEKESWQNSADSQFNSGEEEDEGLNSEAKFPYEQWEVIWNKSKAEFSERFQKVGSATHLDIANNEVKNKTEESAQDLADFVRGLEILSGSLDPKKSRKSSFDKSRVTNSPHPKCEFISLPHKDGLNHRVGNPLAKDFLSKIEEGILCCESGLDTANKVVLISKMVSYWRNNRDRILGQMTVWLNETPTQGESEAGGNKVGAIIPQVTVSGTLTRRAVEPTWMTASNAYIDRIGSELKSMIQAPPLFYFVGADVDSQELWIASLIGDAHFAGLHGSTALGWMTLQGNKAAGTDMHSKTATLIGIGRDQSKILNYARIYGAGATFAERLLLQFNRQLTGAQAKAKANTMYKMTKGERRYILTNEGKDIASEITEFKARISEPFSRSEIMKIMNFHNLPTSDYFGIVKKIIWDGGTESHMFNNLEAIAQGESPQTPILGCHISRSLVPSVVQNDYMTSRVNWVVQSSAVDYLHLMLTCMGWLIKKYDINARFSISVHDEVRYLVSSEDKHRLALALQITNFLTRAYCSYQLKIYDLPQSIAFFSCVDIDKVLRKEVNQDCVTPSNPKGLSKGYDIPEGEALTILDTLTITKGQLSRK